MTSKYFKYFNNTKEHKLLDSITAESIKMTGVEIYYLPKEFISDDILGEAKSSNYSNFYRLDANLSDATFWEGAPDSMTKFGFMSDNRMTFRFAIKTFKDLKIPNRDRPMTGDLIYVPFSTNYQEICDTQDEKPFYAMGKTSVYEVITEMFKFNEETFNTGNTEIDLINTRMNNQFQFERAQNEEIKTEADTIRTNIDNIFGGL